MTAKKSIKHINNKKEGRSSRLRRRVLLIVAALLILTLLLISAELIRSNLTLSVSQYELHCDKVESPVRIVLISDIHGKRYPGGNGIIFDTVRAQSPDLILLTGDALDRKQSSDNDLEFLRDTLLSLGEIAPVYFSLGNHELQNPRLEDIKQCITECHAVLFEKTYLDTEVHGNKLRLGGINTYFQWDFELYGFLDDYCDTDRIKLMLCHNPEYFLWGVKDYDIDLMLCGHTHAGMVRLPYIGALYVPEQGTFPEYDRGMFTVDGRNMVISAGVGNSPLILPRFLNPSEITVIDIIN